MYIPIIILFVLLVFLLRIMWENRHFKITYTNFFTDKFAKRNTDFNEEFKYIFVSDLHDCKFGKKNKRLIKKINEINPDAILVGGDLISVKTSPCYDNAIDLLKELSKKHKVYYTYGNHETRALEYEDRYGEFYESFKTELDNIKVIMVQNEGVSLNEYVRLYGLELDLNYYKEHTRTVLEPNLLKETFKELDESFYNILMTHHPKYFYSYTKINPDLILSGHIHGGMIRLPLLGGLISPDYQLFPRFDRGVYTNNKSIMLLSSGLGTHTLKFRLFNKPELNVITIKSRIN